MRQYIRKLYLIVLTFVLVFSSTIMPSYAKSNENHNVYSIETYTITKDFGIGNGYIKCAIQVRYNIQAATYTLSNVSVNVPI